MGEASIHTS